MFDASTLEVFIASTNDLTEERHAVEEVLRDWNSRNGKSRQIILKPIRWEEDTTPELGPGSFQAVINDRLLDPADILIGIVGKRLGSPTKKSIAGTVEEIERFAAARKPVLLYFSDREFNLSEVDPQDLERVRQFRDSMNERGLYLTFKDINDFKTRLRSHLDTLLQDFKPLLIPAGRALAYGYFTNFIEPTQTLLRGLKIDLPDYKVSSRGSPSQEQEDVMSLSFSSYRIRIARPTSLDDATDNSVFDLQKKFLAEINVKTPSMRRAFRIYIPKATKGRLDDKIQENSARLKSGEASTKDQQLDQLDVVDFPTPIIAVNKFVKYLEKFILKGKDEKSSASGYWQRQKTVQYDEFFDSLDSHIEENQLGSCVSYFPFSNSGEFKLPD